jgi:hypothetical protein
MADEDRYLRLTPKGMVMAVLLKEGGMAMSGADELTEIILERLSQMAVKCAAGDVPAMVFDEGRWHWVGLERTGAS